MSESKIQGKWAGMQVGATHDPENRPDSDFYETPKSIVRDFLDCQSFTKSSRVWEPACGGGNISEVLKEYDYDVISSDLFDHGYGIHPVDFLETPLLPPNVSNIITNPPFRLAEEFAWHALDLLEKNGGHMLALFNRLAWLESQRRHPLFTETPMYKVWVLSARPPMMHRPGHEGKKIKTGTVAYAWFIWSMGYEGQPTIGWIL